MKLIKFSWLLMIKSNLNFMNTSSSVPLSKLLHTLTLTELMARPDSVNIQYTVYKLFVQCTYIYIEESFKFKIPLAITFSSTLSIPFPFASTTLPRLGRKVEKKDCPNDFVNHPFKDWKLVTLWWTKLDEFLENFQMGGGVISQPKLFVFFICSTPENLVSKSTT